MSPGGRSPGPGPHGRVFRPGSARPRRAHRATTGCSAAGRPRAGRGPQAGSVGGRWLILRSRGRRSRRPAASCLRRRLAARTDRSHRLLELRVPFPVGRGRLGRIGIEPLAGGFQIYRARVRRRSWDCGGRLWSTRGRRRRCRLRETRGARQDEKAETCSSTIWAHHAPSEDHAGSTASRGAGSATASGRETQRNVAALALPSAARLNNRGAYPRVSSGTGPPGRRRDSIETARCTGTIGPHGRSACDGSYVVSAGAGVGSHLATMPDPYPTPTPDRARHGPAAAALVDADAADGAPVRSRNVWAGRACCFP